MASIETLALDAAHARGLVHRDVKPANVLLAPDQHAYLADFGLARSAGAGITRPGQLVGTADYTAPELLTGASASPASDAYALACLAVECLTGKPPFTRDGELATLYAHANDPIPDLSDQRPQLPAGLPNIDSVQAHFGGERWFHLDLPRHLFHFGPRSLSALIERAGLRVARIGHLYPEIEAIGLVQTTLNRAGFEDNLLYRFAKRDTSAPSGPRVYASLALALAAASVAVAWSGIAPLLRTGASIQLVAERPT